MAEALSLAASIVAVVGAAEGTVRTLSTIASICNASDETIALVNEISDLRVVLYITEGYIRSARGSQLAHEHIQQLSGFVSRAKGELLNLDKLTHLKIPRPQSSPERIALSKYEWIRAVKKVHRLHQNLRDIRISIVIRMTMMNSWEFLVIIIADFR